MKPRCTGAKTPGHFTSFDCVLDDGHDGFCEPYVAPTVDEWRAMKAKSADAEAQAAVWREHTSALVAAMKTWGSWEDGVPDASDAGECGDVGRAFNAARDALAPDMNLKAWRCSACGKSPEWPDSAWRWTGLVWQHTHADAPQAGHFDAVYADPARALLDREMAASANVARLQAEIDALRAIVESGKGSP